MYLIRKPTVITKEIINEAIKDFYADLPRLKNLYDYYLSKNEVDAKPKFVKPINNNIAGYITRTVNSYFVGNPVRYLTSEKIDIDPILDLYLRQDKASVDKALGKDVSIFGRAFELIYMDEKSDPRSVKLSPLNTFVVFDTSAEPRSLFAVNILKLSSKQYIYKVYTENEIITYTNTDDDFLKAQQIEIEEHHFGRVPITLYQNNEEEMGDFENVITDIDAYNRLKTNRLDDIDKFIDSLLMLKGVDLGETKEDAEENARRIKKLGVLELPEEGDAGFLSNTLNQDQIQTFADSIKEDIHMYSFVPNLSDENFATNSSGVAMKYKLLGLEQLVQDKESSFVRGLKRRLKIYRDMLLIQSRIDNFEIEEVEIQFNRNMPSNDLETAQIIQYLADKGLLTKETLASQLSFVQNPKAEVEEASQNSLDPFAVADMIRKVEQQVASEIVPKDTEEE